MPQVKYSQMHSTAPALLSLTFSQSSLGKNSERRRGGLDFVRTSSASPFSVNRVFLLLNVLQQNEDI